MFVSSYNTYIQSSTSKKERVDSSKERLSQFDISKSFQTPKESQLHLAKQELLVNYISNYKALNNQQRLQEKTQNSQAEKTKFTKISTLQNAKIAYMQNSNFIALHVKPKTALNQTLLLDNKLPQKALEAQELILKRKMLNTYVANENYYKITA